MPWQLTSALSGRALSYEARGACKMVRARAARPTTPDDGPLQRVVRRRHHSLKKVMSVGAVVFASEHAAVPKICGQRHTGRGHCGRAFRQALCDRERFELPASPLTRTGSPFVSYL